MAGSASPSSKDAQDTTKYNQDNYKSASSVKVLYGVAYSSFASAYEEDGQDTPEKGTEQAIGHATNHSPNNLVIDILLHRLTRPSS
jgi:hypothetical protein